MKLKDVAYHNRQFYVPEWANYVAADYTGHVYAYRYKPRYTNVEGSYSKAQDDLQSPALVGLMPASDCYSCLHIVPPPPERGTRAWAVAILNFIVYRGEIENIVIACPPEEDYLLAVRILTDLVEIFEKGES